MPQLQIKKAKTEYTSEQQPQQAKARDREIEQRQKKKHELAPRHRYNTTIVFIIFGFYFICPSEQRDNATHFQNGRNHLYTSAWQRFCMCTSTRRSIATVGTTSNHFYYDIARYRN